MSDDLEKMEEKFNKRRGNPEKSRSMGGHEKCN
jgi:hypothetical protein